MTCLRVALLAVLVAVLAGCGRDNVDVEGAYRDASNPAVRYELRAGGGWAAESVVEVSAGVFPHGAGRRLEGSFTRVGDVLELVCTSAGRQDPVSGSFIEEEGDLASCNHRLLIRDGELVPIGEDGETEGLFASDLNPFGARKLVREVKP